VIIVCDKNGFAIHFQGAIAVGSAVRFTEQDVCSQNVGMGSIANIVQIEKAGTVANLEFCSASPGVCDHLRCCGRVAFAKQEGATQPGSQQTVMSVRALDQIFGHNLGVAIELGSFGPVEKASLFGSFYKVGYVVVYDGRTGGIDESFHIVCLGNAVE
jgi:hypothetical protein